MTLSTGCKGKTSQQRLSILFDCDKKANMDRKLHLAVFGYLLFLLGTLASASKDPASFQGSVRALEPLVSISAQLAVASHLLSGLTSCHFLVVDKVMTCFGCCSRSRQVLSLETSSDVKIEIDLGIQSSIEIDGTCGYGKIGYERWPYGYVGSIGASHPLVAGHASGGCGACVRIFCSQGQVCSVFVTSMD